jgi:hypothetical protein
MLAGAGFKEIQFSLLLFTANQSQFSINHHPSRQSGQAQPSYQLFGHVS